MDGFQLLDRYQPVSEFTLQVHGGDNDLKGLQFRHVDAGHDRAAANQRYLSLNVATVM